MADIIEILTDKDDAKAYQIVKNIAAESEFSDIHYCELPQFKSLLSNKKSYIRTRAFILCCSQARWDKEGIIHDMLPDMFRLFHDEKPTVVRQCLKAVKEVAAFLPELCSFISAELNKIDLSNYKDSMAPLIYSDICELRDLIKEIDEGACSFND